MGIRLGRLGGGCLGEGEGVWSRSTVLRTEMIERDVVGGLVSDVADRG